jgi:hypothetical protein
MKISEYIAELEKIKAEVGDVEVQTETCWGRGEANAPSIQYALILKGRQHKPRFWSKYEGDNCKGGVVCRV